jgi:hypothetical protein
MAAASTDPKLRAGASANVRGALAACAAGSACVLIASGGAALSMRPSLAPNAGALWMSALALASMIGAPLLIARSTRRHTTLASTATLIVALSAMNVIPAYLNGSQHGNVIATFMIAMGGALLFCWRHLGSTMAKAPPPANESIRTLRPLGCLRCAAAVVPVVPVVRMACRLSGRSRCRWHSSARWPASPIDHVTTGC